MAECAGRKRAIASAVAARHDGAMSLILSLLLQSAVPAISAPLPAVEASDPLPEDWRAIPDEELLVMTLAKDRTGDDRTGDDRTGDDRIVLIRLAPALAPLHVANIRRLVAAGWWNGESVYRVQENWVTQWGDASERKALPPGVAQSVLPEFEIAAFAPAQRTARGDPHAAMSGVTADGWPVAGDGQGHAWLPHCYGMVGVARNTDPTSGTGAELFTPIGQSARRLDRNYAVVGRVIAGMGYLSGLPRSTAPMGFYATPAERSPIISVTLASDLPPAQRPRFAYRATDNARFAAALRKRENPAPPTIGSGAIDVCEIPLEVKRLN